MKKENKVLSIIDFEINKFREIGISSLSFNGLISEVGLFVFAEHIGYKELDYNNLDKYNLTRYDNGYSIKFETEGVKQLREEEFDNKQLYIFIEHSSGILYGIERNEYNYFYYEEDSYGNNYETDEYGELSTLYIIL